MDIYVYKIMLNKAFYLRIFGQGLKFTDLTLLCVSKIYTHSIIL